MPSESDQDKAVLLLSCCQPDFCLCFRHVCLMITKWSHFAFSVNTAVCKDLNGDDLSCKIYDVDILLNGITVTVNGFFT